MDILDHHDLAFKPGTKAKKREVEQVVSKGFHFHSARFETDEKIVLC